MRCADRSIRFAAALLLASTLLARPAAAQWRFGADFGLAVFHGMTTGATAGDSVALEPYGPTQFGARLARGVRPWEIALDVHHAAGSLRGAIGNFGLIDPSGLSLWTVRPLMGRRVVRMGPGSELWVEVGPSFNVWSAPDLDTKLLIGGGTTITLRQPLSGRLQSVIRAEAAAGPSPYHGEPLPPEIRAVPVWQFGLLFGLDFRL